jgi:hypothetical protein
MLLQRIEVMAKRRLRLRGLLEARLKRTVTRLKGKVAAKGKSQEETDRYIAAFLKDGASAMNQLEGMVEDYAQAYASDSRVMAGARVGALGDGKFLDWLWEHREEILAFVIKIVSMLMLAI